MHRLGIAVAAQHKTHNHRALIVNKASVMHTVRGLGRNALRHAWWLTGLGTTTLLLTTSPSFLQTLDDSVFALLNRWAQLGTQPEAVSSTASLMLVALMMLIVHQWPTREPRHIVLASSLVWMPWVCSAVLLQLGHWWLPPCAPTLGLGVALGLWIARRLRTVARRAQRARQLAHATLQAMDEAILTIDPRTHRIRFANPMAEQQAGRTGLRGLQVHEVFPFAPHSQAQLYAALSRCQKQRTRIHLHDVLALHTPDGERALRATASPVSSPDGLWRGVVLVLSDVTDALAASRRLDRAANYDALTDLPNRVLLQERMTMALSRAQRRDSTAAILFLDLDHFKHINDSLGHRTGDKVLKIVAARLLKLCRDTDTVARWGGDEFVLLMEDVDGHAGAALAAGKVVEALSQDIEVDGNLGPVRLPGSVSVGVVLAPQDGSTMEELLAKADMAMYRAKALPQANFQFWSDDINSRLHERLNLEEDLREGIRQGHLVMHYQPQFALDGRRLVGMEALMRWQRGPHEMVMPGEFIPVAEACGLMVDLGAWGLLQAARQIAQWQRTGLPVVPISVNVSATQCENRDIVQAVRLALDETGIAPALLRLEITESTAMNNADTVIGLLQEIRALGVGLAVDDFGTGYSSLSYLKRFPIDALKIDRSFVNDNAIVRATVALAHGLGLQVVAEGVETEEQSRSMFELGCDTVQGYWFGKPQGHEAMGRLLAAR
jgi:diguanylate cyclase (GGDEF)-like protein